MKELMAKDCLSNEVLCVHDEDRPDINAENYAVFKDPRKKKFIGLVSRAKIIHPQRIFADLIPNKPVTVVLPDTPISVCEEKMREMNVNALPVMDENHNFQGVITSATLAKVLNKPDCINQENVKLFDAIKSVLHGIEHYHDSYTLMHEENTALMMKHIAQSMGYDEEYCNNLYQTGSLHDIGKLVIPPHILDKPAKLNPFEREIIEMHPEFGHKMIEKIDHPLAQLAASINLHHHENYNGSGYPKGLKKNAIPIEARICSLCDVYEAMRAHRPYHEGISSHKYIVEKILSKKSNGIFYKFDPMILEVFREVHEEFDQIFCTTLQNAGLS